MRSVAAVIAPVVLGLALVNVIFLADPFAAASDRLDATFAFGTEQERSGRVWPDPRYQEASHGEDPIKSLDLLASVWSQRPRGQRVYLIGNSQTISVVLAADEEPRAAVETTYADHVRDYVRSAGWSDLRLYLIGVPNLSYTEALWYLLYIVRLDALAPDGLIVQLNYESFRKTGIRDGLLKLLDDRSFRGEIEHMSVSSGALGSVFRAALRRHAQLATGEDVGGPTAVAASYQSGIGTRIEHTIRGTLETIPSYARRETLKASLLGTLYRIRVYGLGIRPTTPRPIGGAPLTTSVASLDALAALCRAHGIQLVFFDAPQNPNAPLHRSSADLELYRATVRDLIRRLDIRYFDFHDAIPASEWGIWMNGPDPIHFGRAAHERFARVLGAARVLEAVVGRKGSG